MKVRNIFLVVVLLLALQRSTAQFRIFTIKREVYENVAELRDKNFSSIDQYGNEMSIEDTTLRYFIFDSVQIKDGFAFEDLYYYDLRQIEQLALKFSNTTINGTFDVSSIPLSIQIDNSNFQTLDLQGSTIHNMVINGCRIDTLLIDGASIENIVIKAGTIGYISLVECHKINSLIIDNRVTIKSIDLQDFRPPTDGNVFIKIGCARESNSSASLLADSKTDFQRIDLDYQNFDLKYMDEGEILSAGTVISNGKRDVVRSLYHTVLKKFEENGQSDNYLRLYRHKKNFEAASAASGSFLKKLGGQLNYFFTYTLQDWWWGFGFQKEKIFRNTFLIFLLWIMLGSVCFKGILKEYPAVFEDKTLADQFNDRRTNLLSRIGISIIGIAILFFGIEFKANQLKFNNRVLSVLIVSIYLSGLVCLGFLANLILTV